MKYFSIFSPDPTTNSGGPTPEMQQAMGVFVQNAIERGEFISGGGFLSVAKEGAVVRRTNGTSRVLDGPYIESKEIVGGFAMLNYASREAAIDGALRFLEVAGDGECITYRIEEGHTDA